MASVLLVWDYFQYTRHYKRGVFLKNLSVENTIVLDLFCKQRFVEFAGSRFYAA